MTYQYTTLWGSRIRLLALLPGQFDDPLHGEMIETDFHKDRDTLPAYEALSYIWGDQANSQPIHMSQPGGISLGTLALGVNLHSALQHLRLKNSKRIIWCDQISINQLNLKERAQEIARMADIYRKAQKVIVWLGPEADESPLAIKTIAYTGSHVQMDPKIREWKLRPNADAKFSEARRKSLYSPRELRAVQKLVARGWFKRLWVRQEVTLARSAVVIAGYDEVPWTRFIAGAAFLDSLIRLGGAADTAFSQDLFTIYEFGCMGAYKDIMDILHACRSCECTEDHDRVYGIFGLLSSRQTLAIQPDYSKMAKFVYRDLVMQYYYQHRKLNILSLCEDAEIPSWVPDLHKLRLNTGLNTRVVQYCWASGDAAAALTLSNDNTIEIYGVKCGILGKSISTSVDKSGGAQLLKCAIVKIVRDNMGEHVSQWDPDRLEIMAKGLLGCLWSERTGRRNHSSIAFTLCELKKWALEESNNTLTDVSDEHESFTLINHIARVLFHGDSCRWTQDGHLGLGFNGCQEGDLLYAILGCRRLILLRKASVSERYRIVGKFDHPAYNDGEAFLGKLEPSWKANYRHLLFASNRPKFDHDDGSSQWHDPRLQHVALPNGWNEGQDQDGLPHWFRTGLSNERSYSDPRLTHAELRKRGVDVQRLVII